MKVLGISGTLVGSKTRILVEHILQQLQQQYPECKIELLDLKEYKLELCDGRPTDQYNEDTQKVILKIEEADAFLIGTTILHGSIPSALKNLFELVPVSAFTDKFTAFAANGGNPLHYLAIENYVKPIASYLKMLSLPEYVFALSSDFDGQNRLVKETKLKEVDQFVEHYASVLQQFYKIKVGS
ncbi:NADPH-dependent FMN reductase [Psychrobacillus sp. NPDC096426]|uniref:NADPH-dependent FMN reductase n=1 Tax=Psychrobacillus sp. NPDC096426 TaxID=3364491 RepID=UPI003808EA6D